MRDVTNIQKTISHESLSIPVVNLKKFQTEAGSYVKEMEIADDLRFAFLCAKLWQRTCWLKKYNASKAPPLLCRQVNESNEDYISRIYGGYYAG